MHVENGYSMFCLLILQIIASRQKMKQMTLFDSFKKKGSNPIKQQQKQNQQPMAEPQPEIDHVPNQNVNHNKLPKIDTSVKKKTKLTLDSDDQNQMHHTNNQQILSPEDSAVQKEHLINKTKKVKKQKQLGSKMCKEESQQMQQPTPKQKTRNVDGKNKTQQKIADDQNPLSQFTDATPIWAQKEHCKDSAQRSPDHPNYDPTTLFIPNNQWSKFTAPMKQFWRIKSQNFDKIVLFKLGKFYEMFYDDAAVGNKYLDLKFMGTKMHTGFPEKSLERYGNELVRLGFKTVIVEQMETPEQMNDRIKADKQKGQKSQKTLNREVTQILTKGTLPPNDESEETYLPNYLLSLRIHSDHYGFSLLQIGTNQIAMGIVQGLENFKTILYQTRPVEVVYDPDNVPGDVCRMMEKTFLEIQMSKIINKKNLWHPLTAICEIERLLKQGNIKKPKIFERMDGMEETNKNLLYSTLSGMFDYLKKVFRFDYVIGTARFLFYEKNKRFNPMVLDSQALQHLEIFETLEGESGSLFKIIDKTKTKFGKRLLRRWIMSPLTNINQLNERLNAIQDLEQNVLEREKMSQTLKKLPDLEKKANKLYHYAIKNTNASKAIYFEDIHVNRLKEFREFMEKLENAWESLMKLSRISHTFKSNRLKNITNMSKNEVQTSQSDNYYDEEDEESVNGNLPNILANLEEFKSYVKWEGNVPVPQKGLVAYYDQLQDEIEKIKSELEKFLDSLRYEMNEPNLKFVHTKSRYQIEMPQKSEKRRPKDFQFSSKKSGYSRYLAPGTKKMVKQLQKTQENLKQQLGLFVSFFFEQFKKKHQIWHRFIENLAQIDCLISLSEYSFQNLNVRPEFVESDKFEIRAAKHPCLTSIDFIPNDIVLDKRVMLLTGPNMGGKSTILRTACTLAVLAQTGCYVPASKYSCSPVDRIFTRIGASDKLELGKSTFFIEMEETKSILLQGSSRSLAIVDELGRGTSTFDGLAIAYSVLKDISQRINCFCLFATHYHILLQEFKSNPQVALMKMDCLIKQPESMGQNTRNSESEIVFLYKLTQGKVDKSFGLSIASKVGISSQAISIAIGQADQMNKYIEQKQNILLKRVLDFANEKEDD